MRIFSLLLLALAACGDESAASSADLASLSLVNGTLTPAFRPAITAYEATLSDSSAAALLSATAAEAGSSITVQGQPLASGATTAPIPIRPARATLAVVVAAADGSSKTYTVTVELYGWQLDESNTGLAGAGVVAADLELYEPPAAEVAYGTWSPPAGTTLRDRRVDVSGIDLSAGNITFERVWIHAVGVGRGMPLVRGGGLGANVLRDCDIDGRDVPLNADGTNPATGSIAVSASNITLEQCNIQGLGSGISFGGDQPVTVERTYVHDLVQGEWFLGSGESHQDGLTTRGFGGALALVRNNRLLTNPVSEMATGPLFIQATWADSRIDNVRVEGNLLEGYGYSLVLERDNGDYGLHMEAVNNRLGSYNGWWCYVEHGVGWSRWSEIYEHDPGQPEGRGAAVAEPLTAENPALASPSALAATAVAGRSVTLTWSDNSSGEAGFRVARAVAGGGLTTIAIAAADATSFTDAEVAPQTSYTYEVAAVNGEGRSPPSAPLAVTTPLL